MDCEEVWMWRAESAILLMCPPYQGDSQCLPDRKAHSGALYLSPMISLRNSWEVQARLHLPPDQQLSHPESGIVRTLYDCPDLPLGPTGKLCRIVVATHPASERKSRVGVTREGVVYELFFTTVALVGRDGKVDPRLGTAN